MLAENFSDRMNRKIITLEHDSRSLSVKCILTAEDSTPTLQSCGSLDSKCSAGGRETEPLSGSGQHLISPVINVVSSISPSQFGLGALIYAY